MGFLVPDKNAIEIAAGCGAFWAASSPSERADESGWLVDGSWTLPSKKVVFVGHYASDGDSASTKYTALVHQHNTENGAANDALRSLYEYIDNNRPAPTPPPVGVAPTPPPPPPPPEVVATPSSNFGLIALGLAVVAVFLYSRSK